MSRPSEVDGQGSLPAAVLWDMDGTLVDSEKIWDVSLADLSAHLGGRLSDRARESMVGSNMDRSMQLLFADLGLPADPAAVADAGRWVTRRTAELFAADLPWRPGAREALAEVRAAGLPMALVTSTERSLTEIALDRIGRHFFHVTVCGDEVDGQNKPHPEPYLRAARLLGVDPAACVAVEDSPTGSAAAVAAGCTTLVVPCDVPVPPGDGKVFRTTLVGLTAADLATLTQPQAA